MGFAAALLCREPRDAMPCGFCRACQLNSASTHPDLLLVSAETGPTFRDDGEALRAGPGQFTRAHHDGQKPGPRKGIQVRALRRLLDVLSLSAAGGGRKVAIIDSLDEVEEEGVATLLKSLEEPPPATTFLVLAGAVDNVPDTILSRCQRVRFRPLAPDVVEELLHELPRPADPPRTEELAPCVRLAQGSVGRALAAVKSGLHGEAAAAVADLLRPAGLGGVERAGAWVRAAGRDLASQRVRVRELLALALLIVRDRAARSGSSDELDALLPAISTGLESIGANVSPDLVLHALWARVGRARRLARRPAR
jgi:DNA polymerase-3 subunit delta'